MTMTTGAVVKPQSANTEGRISYNGGDREAPNKAPSYNSVGHKSQVPFKPAPLTRQEIQEVQPHVKINKKH